MTRTMRWMAVWGLIALLSVTPRAAQAELPREGAELAPADAAVLIELDNLAELRAELEHDPLVQFLRDHTPDKGESGAWQAIQERLGLSGGEIIDRYFGRNVAIVGEGTEHGGPGVVFSRVAPNDAERAIHNLDLELIAETGAFRLFRSPDDKGRIAFGNGWMALGDPRHEDYLRAVLEGVGQVDTLAESDKFQHWMGKVAEGTMARLFAEDTAKDRVHALGLRREGGRVEVRYAGASDDVLKLKPKLGAAGALDFGPLPPQTLSATTFNIIDREPDARAADALDRVFAPASYTDDVLPKLEAPFIIFLGEVRGEQLEPAAPFSVPVVGMAVKMSDVSAAEDLDRALQNLVMLANLGAMHAGLDAVEQAEVEHGGVSFRTANFGPALAKHVGEPGLENAVQLSFGRIDDWYVIATHAKFFRWSIDAHQDAGWSMSASDAVQGMDMTAHAEPVLSTFVRTPELAAHLQTWIDHIDVRRPEWLDDAEQLKPETRVGRVLRGVSVFAGVLDHYEGASLQIYGGEGARTLRGDGTLQRR